MRSRTQLRAVTVTLKDCHPWHKASDSSAHDVIVYS